MAMASVTTINSTDKLSDALQKLINQFNETPVYQRQTQDQLRERASGEYQSYYDQLRMAARQAQERSDLALSQQQENLARTYDKQREASAKQYQQAYSQAGNALLRRGMQRSSYGAQSLSNIDLAAAEAQQGIWDEQTNADRQIGAQRAQLAQQLGDQLRQYDSSQAADVLNRMRELEEQDYTKSNENLQYRNTLSAQIYEYMNQEEQAQKAADQWQMEFNENVRQFNEKQAAAGKSGGSGGKSSGSKSSAAGNDAAAAAGGAGAAPAASSPTLGTLLSTLSGGSAPAASSAPEVIKGISKSGLSGIDKIGNALSNAFKKANTSAGGGGGGKRVASTK